MKLLFKTLAFCIFFVSCTNSEEENLKELQKIATQINEKCPQVLDSETRIEGIAVKEPNTLVYRYTLLNLKAENMDTAQFYRIMWPGIMSNIKVSPEMKKLRKNNVNIEYFYQDKDKKAVYTFKIGPKDYN
jgi:hypothetical protein